MILLILIAHLILTAVLALLARYAKKKWVKQDLIFLMIITCGIFYILVVARFLIEAEDAGLIKKKEKDDFI